MKKLEMVRGGLELLVATGVSVLVGGAVALVKPKNLGAIKRIAAGAGGFAISCMAVDGVTDYVNRQLDQTIEQVKGIFVKKEPEIEENETIEEEEA